jgi:hypothetical protein
MGEIIMFRAVQRKEVVPTGESAVEIKHMFEHDPLPVVITPLVENLDLCAWVEENRPLIDRELTKYGGIVFRGFNINTVERFNRFARTIAPELANYTERTAPRADLGPSIYTSTEHPKDQYIHFHNANSYSHRWPMKIWFCCITPAAKDGRTPIADCRKVYNLIDPKLRGEFERRKVMYLRNFRQGVGLPWQETFRTDDPEVVRQYCADAHIDISLFDQDRLRTRQIRQAAARHPFTGENVWFNQAHLFHVSSLDSEVGRVLQKAYAEEDLPRNAYFGDGESIPNSVVSEIIDCYRQAEVSFDWQRGDVMMLDNMLAAHARTTFEGERLIAVTFAELYTPPN